jgi:hypothetical protein
MKCRAILLAPLIAFSFTAQAEIAELRFNDTQNQPKIVVPSVQWINPATSFEADVISGLDRYVQLSLLNVNGASLWSTKSSKVTVDDRMTSSSGYDYYGKRLSVPAFGEDNYTLREVITDLQNNEISRRDYVISIDRTPLKLAQLDIREMDGNMVAKPSLPAFLQVCSMPLFRLSSFQAFQTVALVSTGLSTFLSIRTALNEREGL